MICNRCGKELSDDATRCDNCFEEVEKIDVEKFKQSLKPKKHTKEKLLILLLIIVLVFVGIYMFKSMESTDTTGGLKERKPSNDPISNTVNTINDVKVVVSDHNIETLNNAVELAYTGMQLDNKEITIGNLYEKLKTVINNSSLSILDNSSFKVEFKQGGNCTITCNDIIIVICNDNEYNFDNRLKCTR